MDHLIMTQSAMSASGQLIIFFGSFNWIEGKSTEIISPIPREYEILSPELYLTQR